MNWNSSSVRCLQLKPGTIVKAFGVRYFVGPDGEARGLWRRGHVSSCAMTTEELALHVANGRWATILDEPNN